ncbi:hypothetical protein BGZ58_008241 [Dissophora ornata]|nr:hypothetical protein BGZ58_008241 [Dissophora ornata]
MSSQRGKEARALIQKTIRSFFDSSNGLPFLILDTRPCSAYRARHLSPSTNIPFHRLDRSRFQLPSKQTPFAVLESPQEKGTDVPDAGSDAAIGAFVSWRKPSDILKSRGWKAEWAFEDQPLFWEIFAEELKKGGIHVDPTLEIVEKDKVSSKNRTPYNFLFKPNPVLVKILPLIEQELATLRSDRLRGSERRDIEGRVMLRCLDVGCGAGRDMAYLVARSANGLSVDGVEWSVLGMDQREDVCELARHLARDTFLQDEETSTGKDLVARVNTLVGKVDSKTGVFWISPSPTSPNGSDEKHSVKDWYPLLQPNIRHYDADLDRDHQELLAKSSVTSTEDGFDLIVMIRFLQRSLFAPLVEHWLRPGGFLVLSTFVSDTDLPEYSKPGPAHRLQSKSEAREIFEALGLKVVMEEISLVEDGTRPVANVVAQKPI